MVTQINIPSDLTDADKALIFQILDTDLNSIILYSLLNGIYTGIVAVTLWNISEINTVIYKSQSIGQTMTAIIILLYISSTINFSINWSIINSQFTNNGQSFWTRYLSDYNFGQIMLGGDIMSATNTILADSTMIWRCWIVWGQQWLIVLPPIFFLVSAIVFYACDSPMEGYFDFLAAIAKGIAPTLLVAQVAAGHAHPNDSWQGSTVSSSLHFGTHSGGHDSQQDSIINGDLEAQQMIDDEYGHHIAVESQEDIGINSEEGIIHGDYNGLDVLEIQV
ncbi:uncharacterized protein BT62DRAFT_1031075 [Guyanagaster necrorhizus]|uniref:Uncharacterized protein n=1 Tax=Guyanagaster necrorhizus TaxID=856835 RepID=A0A9P7W4K4_9AGAR|nr:uncharacterized protein BT62DRAFT_1031075 [Guyanagaster necrorhizus MCA 3950]KAG7451845.1 hypothetical protein BT62DRAFT_1031075 [Guyanagaster necrorhizus MCA 3950]